MSFLTRCYVWEASVQNQFKPGKTKLNGIWKHAISKNWIKSMENRWNSGRKISPGFATLGILNDIQEMMATLECELEHLQGRIIFMSMYNDMIWWTPGNEENCVANSVNVATYAKRFPFGCWSYLGPGCEKSGMELTLTSQMVNGIELPGTGWSISLKAGILFGKRRIEKVKVVERN